MSELKLKNGSIMILIGRQGSGKSPIIKRFAERAEFKNTVAYDPRREYPDNYVLFHKFSNFKAKLPEFKKCFIIAEEATGFIAAFKDMELAEFLIAIEHGQNVLMIAFHSCMDVPPYMLRLCRYIVMLDTNDDPEEVRKARKLLYPYLLEKIANPGKDIFIDRNAI